MREILFKAKAINRDIGYHRSNYKNGDWVYGLVTKLYDNRFENLPAKMTDLNGVSGIEIDHDTICQYTGLTDKNGNKIWENDVALRTYSQGTFTGKIVYDRNSSLCHKELKTGFESLLIGSERDIEVIGNIFDNPELLKGDAE